MRRCMRVRLLFDYRSVPDLSRLAEQKVFIRKKREKRLHHLARQMDKNTRKFILKGRF